MINLRQAAIAGVLIFVVSAALLAVIPGTWNFATVPILLVASPVAAAYLATTVRLRSIATAILALALGVAATFAIGEALSWIATHRHNTVDTEGAAGFWVVQLILSILLAPTLAFFMARRKAR